MSYDPSTIVISPNDTAPYYLRMQNGGDLPECGLNGIAYFLAVFEECFEDATNKLQYGATSLTEAMQEVTKVINDAKDEQLKTDNTAIQNAITEANKHVGDDNYQKYANNITTAQQQYKVDDASYQSQLQAMSPITTADSDLTTTISENNNTINSMATSIVGILKILAEQLIRLS